MTQQRNMNIKKIEKEVTGALTLHAYCKDLDNSSSCIHNDRDQELIFLNKAEIGGAFHVIKIQVNYCPYCGFSYQSGQQ